MWPLLALNAGGSARVSQPSAPGKPIGDDGGQQTPRVSWFPTFRRCDLLRASATSGGETRCTNGDAGGWFTSRRACRPPPTRAPNDHAQGTQQSTSGKPFPERAFAGLVSVSAFRRKEQKPRRSGAKFAMVPMTACRLTSEPQHQRNEQRGRAQAPGGKPPTKRRATNSTTANSRRKRCRLVTQKVADLY